MAVPDPVDDRLFQMFNGSARSAISGMRLEGLHYVHVADSERYAFEFDGIHIPEGDMTTISNNEFGARYMKGLLAAPSMVVFNSVRNKIVTSITPNAAPSPNGTGGTQHADVSTLAGRMAQLCIASCVASGTGVYGGPNSVTIKNTGSGSAMMRDLKDAYKVKILRNVNATDREVADDILNTRDIVVGFEIVNEAYANFFHTNHHNRSSPRFARGIRFGYVAIMTAFHCPAIPTAGLDFAQTVAQSVSEPLVDLVLRDVIHDTRHDFVAHMVYDRVNDVSYPVTDHNRYSFSNAPAGLSDVSAAVSILNTAGALLHTDYADAVRALQALNGQIGFANGTARFQYSPFAHYITGNQVVPIPGNIEHALALAGALALESNDQNNRDACPFFVDTQFTAVAVRKRATAAARAVVTRHIALKAASTAARRGVTAAHPAVTTRIDAIVAADIANLVL